MKGIILAGGKGTRLYPITRSVCKQLLPVYDKPLVYYSLSILMFAGIRDILIITTPKDISKFKDLLGNGKDLGLHFSYAVQAQPKGIPEAFLIGSNFIGRDKVALILGDNIFYGHDLTDLLKEAATLEEGALVFGYYVKDPQKYGVIKFDRNKKVVFIEEKPKYPASNWVVTGLYFYDNNVINIAKKLKSSFRGELEISDINNEYIRQKKLKVKLLHRGYAWLDTGAPDSLIDASIFIKTIEERQGLKVGCIEEVAYRLGYINKKQLEKIAKTMNTPYGEYLGRIHAEEV
jgi:glucose-1-phosphate thymidylyltransferase